MATTQSDPKAKAAAIEDFLTKYPQSVVKKTMLDMLIDSYQQQGDMDKTVSAASRLLQVDPINLKAIYISVFIKKGQCAKTSDQQTCDDAAALAQKGSDGDQAGRHVRRLPGSSRPTRSSRSSIRPLLSTTSWPRKIRRLLSKSIAKN